MNRKIMLAASMALLTGAVSATEGQRLSLGAGMPQASIVASAEFGSSRAWASGQVSADDAAHFCGATAPDSMDGCVSELLSAEEGRLYTITADCEAGQLTTHDRRTVTLAGEWEAGSAAGRTRWQDDVGSVIEVDGEGEGFALAQHWEILCAPPNAEVTAAHEWAAADAKAKREAEIAMMLGAIGIHPLAEEPTVQVAVQEPVTEQVAEEEPQSLREASIAGIDHNGSLMWHDARQGVLYYDRPKTSLAGLVERGTILFKGEPWTFDGDFRLAGTAYTFRKGCAPAAYRVEGGFVAGGDPSSPDRIVLRGASPIREKGGCAILGYTNESPNAELVFQLNYGDV